MSYLRGRVIGFGLILMLAALYALVTGLSHQMNGVQATATVLAHVSECKVQYRLVVEDHDTTLPLDCEAATAFQNRIGINKVKILREDFVRLRYVPRGGKPYEAKVAEINVLPYQAPGSQLTVVYDPNHLDDVRTPMTMGLLGAGAAVLLLGLFLVMLGVGPSAIVRAFSGRPKQASAPAKPEEDWSEAAMIARLRAATAPAARVQTPSSPSASARSFGKRA